MKLLWNKKSTKVIGDQAENIAKQYLVDQGLKIEMQNYHCRFGEIDIIARSASMYIFVEVKYHNKSNFGGAISAISADKQKKIQKSAQMYLHQQQLNEYNTEIRFDVITLDGDLNKPTLTWLTNSF